MVLVDEVANSGKCEAGKKHVEKMVDSMLQ